MLATIQIVLEIIQIVLIFILVVLSVRSFFLNLKKKRRIEAKRALLSPRSRVKRPITAHAISEFIRLLSNSDYSVSQKSRSEKILSWLDRVKTYMDGTCETPSVATIQKDINQVLKYFAEMLNDAYRADEEFRKKISFIKSSELKDSYSAEQIQSLVFQAREMGQRVKYREKVFWMFHDIARDLGFETWGDVSYKTYLYLKPE